MAVKIENVMSVFEDGKRVYSVKKTHMVNSWAEAKEHAVAHIEKEYPDVRQASVVFEEDHQNIGMAFLAATYQGRIFRLITDVIPTSG